MELTLLQIELLKSLGGLSIGAIIAGTIIFTITSKLNKTIKGVF